MKKSIDEKDKVLERFMKEFFHYPTLRKAGFFTNEMRGDYKVYAHIYIDDAALGMPLIKDDLSVRPYVDWGCIEIMLETAGVLPVAADRNTRKIAFALREANFFPLVNCINAEHNPSTQRP